MLAEKSAIPLKGDDEKEEGLWWRDLLLDNNTTST
jgi:hypothetical protein